MRTTQTNSTSNFEDKTTLSRATANVGAGEANGAAGGWPIADRPKLPPKVGGVSSQPRRSDTAPYTLESAPAPCINSPNANFPRHLAMRIIGLLMKTFTCHLRQSIANERPYTFSCEAKMIGRECTSHFVSRNLQSSESIQVIVDTSSSLFGNVLNVMLFSPSLSH